MVLLSLLDIVRAGSDFFDSDFAFLKAEKVIQWSVPD